MSGVEGGLPNGTFYWQASVQNYGGECWVDQECIDTGNGVIWEFIPDTNGQGAFSLWGKDWTHYSGTFSSYAAGSGADLVDVPGGGGTNWAPAP